jgi:hypothetical protein
MSLVQIEAELENLSAEELHRLALKSWATMQAKSRGTVNECSETNEDLLASLDQAVTAADLGEQRTYSADEVRSRLKQWISK